MREWKIISEKYFLCKTTTFTQFIRELAAKKYQKFYQFIRALAAKNINNILPIHSRISGHKKSTTFYPFILALAAKKINNILPIHSRISGQKNQQQLFKPTILQHNPFIIKSGLTKIH